MNENQWFTDIEFWEEFAPIMFDAVHWAEVPEVADAVTRLSRFNLYGQTPENEWKQPLTSAPKILDLCCGLGRISTELAMMGFSVTGVDLNESFLNTAKEDALAENLNIEYIHSDARTFIRPDFFDTIVNLYISFGYFENRQDDLKVLRNAYTSLKKDGTFIIETLGKEIAVRDFIENEWFERAGCKVLTSYAPLDSWAFLKNRWILLKDGKKVEKTFVQRLYSGSELKTILQEAGFEKIDIYGDWDESSYDQHARMLIAVCNK
ncbi:MAG: class I SAM-dependent methyltransferase [Treponema sp.]|nr:class I SAM-dependent methyltransferase [Treponema sp.]MCL2250667.1 class I SAM-dependent methyltransferase [Treponema sp.]